MTPGTARTRLFLVLCAASLAFPASSRAAGAALSLTPAPGSPFATPQGGGSLAVGDVNGDGVPDVVTVRPSSTDLTVLLGTGNGGMTASTDTFAVDSTGNAYDVELADLDSDGDLDVAIANQAARTITVLLGDGAGGFTAAQDSPFHFANAQDSPLHLAAGDIDGDGKTDLVASIVRFGDPDQPGVVVLRNTSTRVGSGPYRVALTPGPLVATPQFGGEAKVADVNRDGHLDVVAAAKALVVLLGNGTGALTPAPGSPYSVGTDAYVYLAAGDLNGDGKVDLVASSTASQGVRTFVGDGLGGFTAGGETAAGASPAAAAIGDLDLDGHADAAVADFTGGSGTILLGDGGGGLTPAAGSPFAPGATYTRAVEIADMNRDGKPDVVLGSEAGSIIVLLNTTPGGAGAGGGGGTTAGPNPPATPGTTTTTPFTVPTMSAVTATDLALQCAGRRLVLVDVVAVGHRVQLFGAAGRELAGKTVSIRLAATGKVAATAKVAADGSFSAFAPLPAKAIRTTNKARYQASIGGLKSLDLKLARRLVVSSISAKGGRVTIKGRVVGPLAKPAATITLSRQLTCTKTEVVKRFKPAAGGSFSVTVPAPSGTSAAVYRLATRVRVSTRAKATAVTASLPRGVNLGR